MTTLLGLFGWNLCVALLLAVAVWLLSRTRPLRERPAACHALWLLVLVKLVTPPLIPLPILPAASDASPDPVVAAPAAGQATLSLADSSNHVATFVADASFTLIDPPAKVAVPTRRAITWPSLGAALLAGSLAVTLVLWLAAARQLRQVGRLLKGNFPTDERYARIFADVVSRCGLTRPLRLIVVDAAVAPMLWASPRQPAIVLPRELAVTLSDDQLRAMLAHEVAHYVRRDHWSNLFAFLVCTLQWWNPLAWFARRRSIIAAEACCDALALARLGGSRRCYAETLLAAVDFVAVAKPLWPALVIKFGEARGLKTRIALLASPTVRPQLSRVGQLLLVSVALLLLSWPIAADAKAKRKAPATVPVAAEDAPALPPGVEKLALPADPQPDEIAGIVVDSEGKPLAGVLVDAWSWYTGNETTTDEQGVFRLKPGDIMGRAEVRWSKAGYSPHYVFQQPLGVKSFVVVLGNQTYFEGTVRGPDGKTVAGATVKGIQKAKQGAGFIISNVETTATTDDNGHYRLYVCPDTYEMQVVVPRVGVSSVADLVIERDQPVSLDVDLAPGVHFQAEVVDSITGKPVEGLVLWNFRDHNILGISDAEGKIVLDDLLPGKRDFNVGQGEPEVLAHFGNQPYYHHGKFGRWWSADAVNEWEHKSIEADGHQRNFDNLSFDLSVGMDPVTIEVEPGVTFTGHVYDPDGKPVAGATVAPAKTGSGNSITGDTRYSVRTDAEGAYRVVMPAFNNVAYNLIAHDGDYEEWRHWANGVSEPLKTEPGQTVTDFDLKLTVPATVRGRVIDVNDRVVADREVRAAAVDLRENRYYDPTVKVAADGSFELKFIRPGKQYIQVSPFWRAAEAPAGTSVTVELAAGEVRKGIELHVADGAAPVAPALGGRTFRINVVDADMKPLANQGIALTSISPDNGSQLGIADALIALEGDRAGLAARVEKAARWARQFTTDATGVVTIGGERLFNAQESTALALAIDGSGACGAMGVLHPDSKQPAITLRMLPLCDVSLPISTEKLPPTDEQPHVLLSSGKRHLLSASGADGRFQAQLPPGDYSLAVYLNLAKPRFVNFTVTPDIIVKRFPPAPAELALDPIELEQTELAKLTGRPAPELRDIAEWRGEPVKLADLRGKVVVLDFWAHWCGPCMASMPDLMELADAYPPEQVVIIAVHDGSLKSVAEMLTKIAPAKEKLWKGRDLPFRVALSAVAKEDKSQPQSFGGPTAAAYGVEALPTTLLIDQRGILVGQIDARNLDAAKKRIDALLGK